MPAHKIKFVNMRLWPITFVIATLLSGVLQPAETLAQRYPFAHISIDQGLIQSQVSALVQDQSGHLWVGTLGGLSCYDGQVFRSFTKRNGLPANEITALACDHLGKLWIGTTNGLSRYDGHTFHNYTLSSSDNPLGNRIGQLVVDEQQIWASTFKSLYRLAKGKMELVPIPHGLPKAIHTDHQKGIWLATQHSKQIYHFHNESWDSVMLPEHLALISFDEDLQGNLVLLTDRGAFMHVAGQFRSIFQGLNTPVFSFVQAADSSYWAGTTGGVYHIKDGAQQGYSSDNGLTDIFIHQIYRDKEENIWFATNGEGLYRFSGATFTAVGERMDIGGSQVSSFAQAPDSSIYFGSFDGGLYRYHQGEVSAIPFPTRQTQHSVTSLLALGNELIIGTQNFGLWRYDMVTKKMRQVKEKTTGSTIIALLKDGSSFWVAGNGHLAKFSERLIREDSIGAASVQAFAKIGNDSMVLATNSGLMLYSHGNLNRLATGTGGDSAQIVCLAFAYNVLWMGTVENGLYGLQLQTGQKFHFNQNNGLASDFIYNITAAGFDDIWVGTGYGICQIKHTLGTAQLTIYGSNDGIPGMESNRNAVLPLANGQIWFGTTGGAVLYHPENKIAVHRPISLELQNIQIFGAPIRDSSWFHGGSAIYQVPQNLRLPWKQNNINFSFQAVSLSGQERIKYRYKLEGLKVPWSEWSPEKNINFSALPPGDYTLMVQCSLDGRTPEKAQLHYSFSIITPFSKSIWFKVLILVGCMLLGVAIQYILAQRKRARAALIEGLRKEEQARIRERTAEDFHDEVGNKITRINLLTNILRAKLPEASAEAGRIMTQIQDNAKQLYGGTRDILWSLQPANDSLYQVLNRIREFGDELFGDTDIHFSFIGIEPSWQEHRIPMDLHRNLIMIFKEALNNTLKYAKATEVHILASEKEGYLRLILEDNGCGFDEQEIVRGRGLQNMQTRAGRLGGTLTINSKIAQGTSITLEFKIPPNKG